MSQDFLCCPDLVCKAEADMQGPCSASHGVCLENEVFVLLAIGGHKTVYPLPINKPVLILQAL